MDESLLLSKIRKIQESMKKINSNTQTLPIPGLVITRQKYPVVSKSVKVVENKKENNKKNWVEQDMGYGIIEDIKKAKENVSLFDMCNLPQQRKNILEAFDPQPSGSQDDIQSDKEINEASIGVKSKYLTKPSLLSFDIFNHNTQLFSRFWSIL